MSSKNTETLWVTWQHQDVPRVSFWLVQHGPTCHGVSARCLAREARGESEGHASLSSRARAGACRVWDQRASVVVARVGA